jgi:hypothetical protein
MPPNALVDWIKTAIARIANAQAPTAYTADKQALEQAKAFARRSCQDFGIGSVRLQTLAVGEELLPSDVARVVVG